MVLMKFGNMKILNFSLNKMLIYCEFEGKYYKVNKNTKDVTKISKKEFLENTQSKNIKKNNFKQKPKPGDKVWIKIKPYKGLEEYGIVKDVLTNKKFHSRGHKVRLESGTIGRIKLD